MRGSVIESTIVVLLHHGRHKLHKLYLSQTQAVWGRLMDYQYSDGAKSGH